jgi:hypothetical protein
MFFRGYYVYLLILARMFRYLRFITFITSSNARLAIRWSWFSFHSGTFTRKMCAAFPGALVNPIVSENSSFVLPSHRGLTPLEIIEDCIEKIQLLSFLGISHYERIEQAQCLHLFSLVDDWNAIARHQLQIAMTAYAELESL